MGTFIIQLARSRGLHVTAVCSARNSEQARGLGAERVIDYASEDFTAADTTYEVVVDLVGNKSLSGLRGIVAPSGSLVLSGGGVPGEGRIVGAVGLLIKAQLLKQRRGLSVFVPQAVPTHESLQVLAGLLEAGAISSRIERTFDFELSAAALRHLETEHARGKVVVMMGHR